MSMQKVLSTSVLATTIARKGLTAAIATIAEASRYTPNGRSKPSCCSSLRSASRRAHIGSSSLSVFASVAWQFPFQLPG